MAKKRYYRNKAKSYASRGYQYSRARVSSAYSYARSNRGKIFGLSTTFVVGALLGYFGFSKIIPYPAKLALAVNPVRFKMSGWAKSVASGMLAGEILRVYFPQFTGMLGNLGASTTNNSGAIPTY